MHFLVSSRTAFTNAPSGFVVNSANDAPKFTAAVSSRKRNVATPFFITIYAATLSSIILFIILRFICRRNSVKISKPVLETRLNSTLLCVPDLDYSSSKILTLFSNCNQQMSQAIADDNVYTVAGSVNAYTNTFSRVVQNTNSYSCAVKFMRKTHIIKTVVLLLLLYVHFASESCGWLF